MKNKFKIEFVSGAVIRDDKEKKGKNKKEPQYAIFDVAEPPELHCPLCGTFAARIDNRGRGDGGPIVHFGRPCQHLLFVGAYQKFNAQFSVMQPKLQEVAEKLGYAPPPDQIVSKLKLDPDTTLVMVLQVPYISEMDNADLVAGFDFTPEAKESETSTPDETD